MPHALQHTCRHLLQAQKPDGRSGVHNRRSSLARAVQQTAYRPGQSAHAHGRRHRNQAAQLHRRRQLFLNQRPALQGHRLAHRRHQARRQRHRRNRRHQKQRLRHACQIAKLRRRLLDAEACRQQILRHQQHINAARHRHDDIRAGHRQGQKQQALNQPACRRQLRTRQSALLIAPLLFVVAVKAAKHNKSRQAARHSAEGSACRRKLQAVGQQHIGQHHHRHHADKLLHNLRNSRRCHQLMSLKITAEAGQNRREENRRSQRQQRIIGTRILNHAVLHQPACRHDQRRRQHQAHDSHQPQRHAEHLPHIRVIALCQILCHNNTNRHRNPGSRNRQQQQVHRISHLVQAYALAA